MGGAVLAMGRRPEAWEEGETEDGGEDKKRKGESGRQHQALTGGTVVQLEGSGSGRKQREGRHTSLSLEVDTWLSARVASH